MQREVADGSVPAETLADSLAVNGHRRLPSMPRCFSSSLRWPEARRPASRRLAALRRPAGPPPLSAVAVDRLPEPSVAAQLPCRYQAAPRASVPESNVG